MCITETWFKAISDVNINDYNIFRLDRATHGGGVSIYVKNTIMSNESNVARLNETDIEQIWACLCFDKQKLLIGCIYRPPNSTPIVNSLKVESIVSARKSCYQKLYSDVVITGDFNFNSIDWSDSACPYVTGDLQAQSFIDCLNECFLTTCVSKPSFQKANYDSNNILDFIITNHDEKLSSVEHSPAFGTTKQGHHLLKCNYIVNESRPVNDKGKTVKLYQNGIYKLFSDYINEINWNIEFENKSINEIYDIFLFHYNYASNQFIPHIDNSKKRKKRNRMNLELKAKIKRRNKMWLVNKSIDWVNVASQGIQ